MDTPRDFNGELNNFMRLYTPRENEIPISNKDKLLDLWISSLIQYIIPNYRKSEYLQQGVLDDLMDSSAMDYESAFITIVNKHLNFIREVGDQWWIRKLTDFILEKTGPIETLEDLHFRISELTEEQADEIIKMYNDGNRASLI